MNYFLILIVLSGSGVSTQSIPFESSAGCLKALSSVLEMEKGTHLTIKSRCVKND
jgi:hypothetical protein